MAELTKLGRYQLKGVLGRGAMGVVYEGLDPSLNRRVAVKTILKNAAIDAETAQMYSAQFAREAQAAGRLNHPNIVGVHDFAEQGDVAYLVMEYIQGRELRSFFEAKEKFEIAETVRIMGELLDALGFAHDAGVIHRDIKPANVMLDANRRVKLADFGVARIQDSERSAAGTMVGTPAFMSPEQISGGKIDKRTDLFSAGTILYQLLTGDQPFTGAGAWTVAKKIMQDDPPQPSSVVKSVSPAFDAIVNKALAKKPSERYANAKEFADALRSALTAGAAQPSAVATTPPIPAPKPAPGVQASEAEVEFWKAIQNSTDAAEFEFYLEQFPGGIYAGLARHKIARLNATPVPIAETTVSLEAAAAAKRREAEEKARQEAEAQAKREAELQAAAKARRDAAEKARQEAEAADRAQREAADKSRQEAEAKARREAETRARVEAEIKAKREADEKAKQERARQADALAKLREQEAARAAEDPEATIAITRPSKPSPAAVSAPRPAAGPAKKSFVVPAVIGAVVVIGGVAAFLAMNRTPAPAPAPVAPAAVAPAPVAAKPAEPVAAPAPAAPVVDEEKIRREVEDRIRREYADKSAAEQAAATKAATAKAMAEKQAAAKAAAQKSSQEKAAADRALAEKAAADRAASEKAASEKAAADKAAAEKAVAEKAAAEKAAAEKAAAEKATAVAAANAGPSHDELVARFIKRKGAGKVLNQDPPAGPGMMQPGEVVYVNNRVCGNGRIREVTGGNNQRNTPRSFRCISLVD